MTFIGQHVLCWQSVRILLDSGLVAFGSDLLVKFDQIVLHGEVEQPLGGLLVQLVVPVHVPGQARQGWNLLLSSDSLDSVPDNLRLVWITHSSDLLHYSNTCDIHFVRYIPKIVNIKNQFTHCITNSFILEFHFLAYVSSNIIQDRKQLVLK